MTDIIKNSGYLTGGAQLRRIYQKLQTGGDKIYKDANLNFKSSWFPVYYALTKSAQPQTIMEITNQIAFTHITVKNIVKALEKERLVKIVPHPKDKRSKLVSLSDDGLLLQKKLVPIWLSFSNALKDVFEIGHPEMTSILARINHSLDLIPLDERVRNQQKVRYEIRAAKPNEFAAIGQLMVDVYSKLVGFPNEIEQPAYYKMLANIGELTKKPQTELLVAVSPEGKISGGVVYFGDMQFYGSGGAATKEKNASGFRLLAVNPSVRGEGLGKLLTNACINKAKKTKQQQVIIHTTKAMQIAWKMYEKIGFKRSVDLDFMQGELAVFGFRLKI